MFSLITKMPYLPRQDRKTDPWLWRSALVVVVVLALVYGLSFVAPTAFSSASHAVAYPFWKAKQSAESYSFQLRSFFSDKADLIDENRELKQELAGLRGRLSGYTLLREENERLRERLGMLPQEEATLAAVLARPPQVPYDVLIINGGRRAGIEDRDRVLLGDGVLLGEVEEVSARTARVLLFSSARQETPVSVQGDDEAIFTAVGRGGGVFQLELPRSVEIEEGMFLTKAVGPRSFIVAVISEIEVPETGASQRVRAKSPVDIFSVRDVFVVPRDL